MLNRTQFSFRCLPVDALGVTRLCYAMIAVFSAISTLRAQSLTPPGQELMLLSVLEEPLYFKIEEAFLPIDKRAYNKQNLPQAVIREGELKLYRKLISDTGQETYEVYLSESFDPLLPSLFLLYKEFSAPHEIRLLNIPTSMEALPVQHALIFNYTPLNIAVHTGGNPDVIDSMQSQLYEYEEQRFAAKFQFATQIKGQWSKPIKRSINVLPGMRLLVIVTFEKLEDGELVFNPLFIRMESILPAQ